MLEILLFAVLLYCFTRPEKKYWNGPTPSKKQRQKALQFIEKYLYENPDSPMRYDYPGLANKNLAAKKYEVITKLHESGEMSDSAYEIELGKILPLIDITEDIKTYG